MALVACTQLKELNLGNTKLTGEWCVVGIDRGPVPSEQRMEQAHCNTPGLLIFDVIVIFLGLCHAEVSFVGCGDFLSCSLRFVGLFSYVPSTLRPSRVR